MNKVIDKIECASAVAIELKKSIDKNRFDEGTQQ